MTEITTTMIVITTKANPTGTTTAPTARRSTCIFEQMPVSELAVMVHGCRQLPRAGRAGKNAWRRSWQRKDHKAVDTRRPLTKNVLFSLYLESRFYAVLSKAA
jgi:hypothetical protein